MAGLHLAHALVLAVFALCTWTAFAQDAILVLSPAPLLATLAGSGRAGFNGDGLAGAATTLSSPSAVAYDVAGNLYFCDTRNHRVRRVSAAGVVTTVAGNGIQGFGGDNGPATTASLDSPLGVAIAGDGTLYIADTRNHRVRRVTPGGIIQTIAGTGVPGFSGDLGPATDAQVRSPGAVAVGSLGEIYLADTGNHRIRRIALDGTVRTIAGNGKEEATGDGGLATSAGLDSPSGLAFRSSDGTVFVADRLNSRVRVLAPNGLISSLSTSSAPVRRAAGLALDAVENLYIADTGNYVLRAVMSKGSGVLLGSGEQGSPETLAGYNATPLGAPAGVAPDALGGLAFSDRDHHQLQHLALPQVAFASTDVGQVSPTRTVLLRNAGDAPLPVTSLDIPAGFSQAAAAGCGSVPFTLAAGAQCLLSVAFAPTTVGSQSGVLAVNSAGVPQRVLLTGIASAAGTLLASSTLLASNGSLSYAGTPVVLTARVVGTGTATPSGVVHLLDAGVQVQTAALGQTGSVSFTTSALSPGQHSLAASYDGDTQYSGSTSAALQHAVTLAPDFTVTPASAQMTVAAGGTAAMDFLLQPVNGTLDEAVVLTFSGLPAGASAVSNAPVPLVLGSNAVTVRLSVTTPAGASQSRTALLLPFTAALLLFVRRRKCPHFGNRVCVSSTVAIALIAGAVLPLLVGCGGGFLSGVTTAGQSAAHTYPITLTATTTGVTGSALVHTASVTLVVN